MGRSGEARDLLEGLGDIAANETYYWYLLGVLRIYTGDNLRDLQGRRAEALEIYARCAELDATRDQVAEYLESPYERRP